MLSQMTTLPWTPIDAPTRQRALFDSGVQYHTGKGEYRGLEFFEVEAKKVINHIPAGLPFNYTINVYRGCSHACAYCLDGETLVLMADGSERPLSKLDVGDEVVGTTNFGRYRRYRTSTVLDTWTTRKRAYRVRLRSGIELVASGDHRFLTDYGWTYVAGCGDHAQPDLGFGTRLLGLTTIPDPVSGSGVSPVVDTAVVSAAELTVESVDDLGHSQTMFDITTSTGDFVANGVVSHNCFARPTHEYLGFNAGSDFDRKIVVKVNAVALTRAETEPGRWAGEPIAMGTNTDPYQRAEGKYRLTRGVMEVLAERANPFSVLTKSPLVLRDLDVLTEAATTTEVAVDFSIATLDEDVWKRTEPGTPHPRQRIEAIRKLNEAGIPSGALMAPIIPGLSDDPDQLAEVARALVDAGARFAAPMYLHLRDRTIKNHWMGWLDDHTPDIAGRHRALYATRGNVPRPDERRLTDLVRQAIAAAGGLRPGARPRRRQAPARPIPPRSQQLDFGI